MELRKTLPDAYPITPEKPIDYVLNISTDMATANSTKNTLKPKKYCQQMKLQLKRIT
jgi:hypothetical protein